MYTTQPRKQQNPWLICPTPRPDARIRLFCFPYAGGSAPIFRQWSNLLPEAEVISIQYPGRGTRMMEPALTDVDSLVDGIVEALLPFLNKPFAFFGHSLGSLLAFEVTRRLRDEHNTLPKHLFVSARKAPQLPPNNKPIHALPHEEFVVELESYGGTPKEVLENKDLMELVLPILRADFQVNETYRFQEGTPLQIPITAYGGHLDTRATESELEQWGIHTTGAFHLHMFEGDHFYLTPQQDTLVRTLAKALF